METVEEFCALQIQIQDKRGEDQSDCDTIMAGLRILSFPYGVDEAGIINLAGRSFMLEDLSRDFQPLKVRIQDIRRYL